MQCLEVSFAVQLIYKSLDVKGLIYTCLWTSNLYKSKRFVIPVVLNVLIRVELIF